MKAYRIPRYLPLPYTARGDLTVQDPIDASVDLARFRHEFEVALEAGPWLDGNTNRRSIKTDGRPHRDMNASDWHLANFQFWTIRFEATRQIPQRRMKAFDAFCQALAYRVSESGMSTSITPSFTSTLAILQPTG